MDTESGRILELKRIPGKNLRLTLTADRITVKLPENLELETNEDLLNHLMRVAMKHPAPEFTLRGDGTPEQLRKHGITLRAQAKTSSSQTFSYEFET